MRMNLQMAEILRGAEGAAEDDVPAKYHNLVGGGFKDVNGCTFLSRFFRGNELAGLHLHGDRTGYEASVNKVHLEDYFDADTPRARPMLAAITLATARFLARRLQRHSSDRYRVIAAISENSYTLRFHKIRAGEKWLDDDLEKYQSEAILVLDSTET